MHEILLCVLCYPVWMWWLEWFVPFPLNVLIVAAGFQPYIALKFSDDVQDRSGAWLELLRREVTVIGFGLFFAIIRYLLFGWG